MRQGLTWIKENIVLYTLCLELCCSKLSVFDLAVLWTKVKFDKTKYILPIGFPTGGQYKWNAYLAQNFSRWIRCHSNLNKRPMGLVAVSYAWTLVCCTLPLGELLYCLSSPDKLQEEIWDWQFFYIDHSLGHGPIWHDHWILYIIMYRVSYWWSIHLKYLSISHKLLPVI